MLLTWQGPVLVLKISAWTSRRSNLLADRPIGSLLYPAF